MPIYDYVCSSCHRLTEVVHGIEAEGPRFCPECGAEGTMTKVVSAPSVHFKGTGWAKKDRGSSAAARAKDETAAASGDGTKGDGAKSDTSKSEAGSPGGSSSSSESSSSGGKSSAGSGSTSSGAESKPASGASD